MRPLAVDSRFNPNAQRKHLKKVKVESIKFQYTGGIIIINVYTNTNNKSCERNHINPVGVWEEILSQLYLNFPSPNHNT